MSENHPVNDYIAGAIGGSAGLIAGHPLDTTKVQIQTQLASSHYTSTLDCIKHVHKQGWVRGFFRGMSWPVISYGAVNSVFFGVYGNTLNFLHQYNNGGEGKPRFWEIYMAGCVGGAAQLVIACPIDLVKVVLQSQIPHGTKAPASSQVRYRGPWACAVDIARRHGVRALYRGSLSMAYRDLPSFGIYTLTYESVFEILVSQAWTDDHGVAASLLAGGLAGINTWLPVIPFDVAKSRLQADIYHTQYKGLFDCIKKNYQCGGLPEVFRGGSLICIRAFLVNAVIFLVYSQSKKILLGNR